MNRKSEIENQRSLADGPASVLYKDFGGNPKGLWTEEEEQRMDKIGQNGNEGSHYNPEEDKTAYLDVLNTYTVDNSNPWCSKVTIEENKD